MQNNAPKYSKIRTEDKPREERTQFKSRIDMRRFTSKVKTMVTDLNQAVAGEADQNNKLIHTINKLRKTLDAEKKRTVDLDQRLRDEFREYKRTENEKIELNERLNNGLHEIRLDICKCSYSVICIETYCLKSFYY